MLKGTNMKYVDIISDREFNVLAADVAEDARAHAWELWRDDLTTEMMPEQLVAGANAILAYFGSERVVTDVQWDESGNCFLWEVQFDQLC